MSEFTKNKIAFAVALAAILFTLSPLIRQNSFLDFTLMGGDVKLAYLYYFMALVLGLAVYFYGIQFLTERPLPLAQRAGDVSYAVAIMAPPFYASLFLISFVAEVFGRVTNFEHASVVVSALLSLLSGFLSAKASKRLAQIFAKRERQSTAQQLEKEELSLLERARTLFESGYFDLSVVECFKAIELALRKALLQRGELPSSQGVASLISHARKTGLIANDTLKAIDFVRVSRNNAAHNIESTSQEVATQVLNATTRVLVSLGPALEEDGSGSSDSATDAQSTQRRD